MNFPSDAAFHSYRPSAWLRVTGADAAGFLQGQFTNDVRLAEGGAAVYGLWLDQKGKVLADSFIGRVAGADEFWIASLASPGEAIRQRLEGYIIADDVVVEDATAETSAVTLLGDGAGAWLASAPRVGAFFRGRRASEENWEWIFPSSSAAAVAAEFRNARELGAGELKRRRILAGIPSVPADIGSGDLPNEGGLDADAISYTKGCYLGQEVMARLKSKGRIRRRLRRVAGSGSAPTVPTTLWQEGTKVGELRSAVPDEAGSGFVGLALLSLASLRPEAPLALSANGPAAALCAGPLA
jgi:tRNA-modifying protein YgfZ